jgi:pyruvate dehydrogenase E1 component
MNTTPDGDYQTYKAESGAYVREHFFGRDSRTRKMVEHMSDDEIWHLVNYVRSLRDPVDG